VAGTSVLVILVAILFKLNNFGLHSCSANVLLCGPTAILMLGVSYELFASFLLSNSVKKYSSWSITCTLTAMVAFALFALMNTYLIGSWKPDRLVDYIITKGILTAIASGLITTGGIYLTNAVRNRNFSRLNPFFMNGVLGIILVLLWIFGSLTKF
jgi:hypothetical protein